jgi:hypothetical protein
MQATNDFDGYELVYIRRCADKNERIHETDIVQAVQCVSSDSSCVTVEKKMLLLQQGMDCHRL